MQVLDENDNNPYFVTDVGNLTVMENSKIGTEVATIQARDPDSGDYGKITYLLDRVSSQASVLSVYYTINVSCELSIKFSFIKFAFCNTGYVRHSSRDRRLNGGRFDRLGRQTKLRSSHRGLGQLSVRLYSRGIEKRVQTDPVCKRLRLI